MKKMLKSSGLKQPWANQVTVGSIEIKVICRPRVKLQELEGALKPGKKSVSVVRELREEDYGREEKRLDSD